MVYRDEAETDPYWRGWNEPELLDDFPALTISAAIEAIHIAETGRDYQGRMVHETAFRLADATQSVHIWRSTRDKMALDYAKGNLDFMIKFLESMAR